MSTSSATQPDEPGHDGAAAPGDHHAATDHGADGGHGDHAHAIENLGPIDRRAWGAGLLGIALGLVVTVAFVVATSGAG